MTLKTKKFNPSDTVACYSGEVMEVGSVLSIEEGKATVALLRSSYEGNERKTTTHIQEYFLRAEDGLYVARRCLNEYVPSKMIVNLDDMEAVNSWRYHPSILEKVKRRFKTVGRLKRDNSPEGLEDAAKYFRI